MKKLLFILFLFTLGCSKEDEGEEMCCETPVSELLDWYNEKYPELLSSPKLSEEQRRLIQADYEFALENPCEAYIEELEGAGASCENPN